MKPPVRVTRITISLPAHLAQRLSELRIAHAVSMSAIAEAAITTYFKDNPDDGKLASWLRAQGLGLRRNRPKG